MTQYKAYVNLATELLVEDKLRRPALQTGACNNKDSVLNYCKLLFKAGLIISYRLAYQPDGADTWYFSSEVMYDNSGLKVIFPESKFG